MKIKTIALVTAAVIAASLAIAAPANALPASAPVAASTSETLSTLPAAAGDPGTPPPPPPVRSDSVKPNYPAGAYFYVCVSPSGSTVTVTYGATTWSVCNGAAAIQQWLESGQFVRTVQLTTSGIPATATFTPTKGCFLALVAGVRLLFEPLTGVLLAFDGPVALITAETECISS